MHAFLQEMAAQQRAVQLMSRIYVGSIPFDAKEDAIKEVRTRARERE